MRAGRDATRVRVRCDATHARLRCGALSGCDGAGAAGLGDDGHERGSISVFVVIVTVGLVAVAALVLDGGRLLAARREAQDIAANAARAGAQALDEGELRAGRMVIDPPAGAAAVARYLARTPATGTGSVSGDTVIVRVRMPVRMLLPVNGSGQRTVTALERARVVQGVTTGEP